MGKVTGFLEFPRKKTPTRPVAVRLRDWREVYEEVDPDFVQEQSSRCMDCGIPFCQQGCPLGNKIPIFNDAVYRGEWQRAIDELLDTNNFPEFTGRLCPAPCESACVLGIADDPVSIENAELNIVEHAFTHGFDMSLRPAADSGRRVAIVGSGPAGLAAAWQLRSAGHSVSVFERSDAIGGLLRYGIPEFKMEKWVLDRRIGLMSAAGVQFHTSVAIGSGGTPLSELQRTFDAVILAVGSTRPRMVPAPGSDLVGVFPAMTYLEASNRAVTASTVSEISAEGLHVVILGGGDTGADCLGTAHRQGAATVTQIEILDTPPETRPFDQPWPTMPRLFKVTTAHEEGGERLFSTETLAFEGDGYVTAISLRDRHTGAEWSASADLVLVAAGFLGPELDRLGLDAPQYVTPRESLSVGFDWRLEELPGDTPVFACGDAVRGQSLIVWAIAEGRSCASAVDTYLGGGSLPAPVAPYQTSW